MKKKQNAVKIRALKRKLLVVAVVVIVFIVSFFLFFKHREVEMTPKQFELLKTLLPWGCTTRYEAGIAIIENFVDATVWSVLLSIESGLLTFLLVFLLAKQE
jgi:hypothetical protein